MGRYQGSRNGDYRDVDPFDPQKKPKRANTNGAQAVFNSAATAAALYLLLRGKRRPPVERIAKAQEIDLDFLAKQQIRQIRGAEKLAEDPEALHNTVMQQIRGSAL